MSNDNDLIAEARAFNTEIANCGINPQRAHELIDKLAERLRQRVQADRPRRTQAQ